MKVSIIKKPDDLVYNIPRVSIGGGEMGIYCVYRGTKEDAIAVIETALEAMRSLEKEPAIAPDGGKKYA